jgi:hypothetical protein
MKSIVKISVRMLLFAALFSLTGLVSAQDRKEARLEKSELRKSALMRNYDIIDSLFTNKSFVLEANYLANEYGDRIVVSPTINFIKVTDARGVLQTGVLSSLGYNGVGGVTTSGDVGGWKVIANPKNLSHYLHFSLQTTLGMYDISLTVTADNHATATLTGLTPGKLIFQGYLETPGNSRVYKGHEIF